MTLAVAAEYPIMMTGEPAADLASTPGPGKRSVRERELVAIGARGQTDAHTASQLSISISTVRSHLTGSAAKVAAAAAPT